MMMVKSSIYNQLLNKTKIPEEKWEKTQRGYTHK